MKTQYTTGLATLFMAATLITAPASAWQDEAYDTVVTGYSYDYSEPDYYYQVVTTPGRYIYVYDQPSNPYYAYQGGYYRGHQYGYNNVHYNAGGSYNSTPVQLVPKLRVNLRSRRDADGIRTNRLTYRGGLCLSIGGANC